MQTVLSIRLPQGTTERVIEAKSNENGALMKFVGLRKWQFSFAEEVFFCWAFFFVRLNRAPSGFR